MSTGLCCSSVTFAAGGRNLIGPLELNLPDQGVTCVLGSNGAGKSLLLRLLYGLLRPASGTVRWAGEEPPRTMVPQQPVMLRRTVLDNLRIVPGTTDEEIRSALHWAGLEGLQQEMAHALSPGVQQQLAIVRARLCKPQWLFLDEPTASLDPLACERVEQMIVQLANDGIRLLLSSHSLAQVHRLATDIVFVDAGTLDYYPHAERFFDAPVTEAARRFLEYGRLP